MKLIDERISVVSCLLTACVLLISAEPVSADSIEEQIVAGDDYTDEEAAEISNALKTAKEFGITFVSRAAKGRGSSAFGAPLEVVNNSDTLALSLLITTIRSEIQHIHIQSAPLPPTAEQNARLAALNDLQQKLQAIQRQRSQTRKDEEEALSESTENPSAEKIIEAEPTVSAPEPESFLLEGETRGDANCRLQCEDLKKPWDFQRKHFAAANKSLEKSRKALHHLENEWTELATNNNEFAAEINDRERKRNELSKKVGETSGEDRARLIAQVAEVTKPLVALRANQHKNREKFDKVDTRKLLAEKDVASEVSSFRFRESEARSARKEYEQCIRACVAEGLADGEKFETLIPYLPPPPRVAALLGTWVLDSYGDIRVDGWQPHQGMVISIVQEGEFLSAFIVSSNEYSRDLGFEDGTPILRNGTANDSFPSVWHVSVAGDLFTPSGTPAESGRWSRANLALVHYSNSGLVSFWNNRGYHFRRKNP